MSGLIDVNSPIVSEINSHYLSNWFDNTNEYLEMRKKILFASPSIVVVIDPKIKHAFGLREILTGLMADTHLGVFAFYSLEGAKCELPEGWNLYRRVDELKTILSTHRKIFVIAPRTIRHFVFVTAIIEGHEHPAYNNLGELNFDARWMLKNSTNGNFDSMLRKAVGYAMPYPDATGDGEAILDELRAAASGMDYGVDCSMSEERVENSMRLAGNYHRVHKISAKLIQVNACQFGPIHTGTLFAELLEKNPEVEYVQIQNDRGSIAKKTGRSQFTLISLKDDLRKRFSGYKKEITVVTPLMIHLGEAPCDPEFNFDNM